MKLKAIARHLLSEQTIGMLDYYRHSELRASWGGPFNGQICRQRLFEEIVASVQPKAFIETGTHIGTTTEFLVQFGRPVYTVEGEPRAYRFARSRFRKRRSVTLVQDDSRNALRRWLDGPLRMFTDASLLFYLDAHWNSDLLLAEELGIIFSHCNAAVVMIDDFEVPWDAAYGYDDYGPGKALNFDYIAPSVLRYGLAVFYPATPACEESGMRRGCVVLANEVSFGAPFGSVSLLRPLA